MPVLRRCARLGRYAFTIDAIQMTVTATAIRGRREDEERRQRDGRKPTASGHGAREDAEEREPADEEARHRVVGGR